MIQQREKMKIERDPEDRHIEQEDERAKRDRMMDQTLADSYPASDPPSTIPNPDPHEDFEAA
jgi:hypothetical protein